VIGLQEARLLSEQKRVASEPNRQEWLGLAAGNGQRSEEPAPLAEIGAELRHARAGASGAERPW